MALIRGGELVLHSEFLRCALAVKWLVASLPGASERAGLELGFLLVGTSLEMGPCCGGAVAGRPGEFCFVRTGLQLGSCCGAVVRGASGEFVFCCQFSIFAL